MGKNNNQNTPKMVGSKRVPEKERAKREGKKRVRVFFFPSNSLEAKENYLFILKHVSLFPEFFLSIVIIGAVLEIAGPE